LVRVSFRFVVAFSHFIRFHRFREEYRTVLLRRRGMK